MGAHSDDTYAMGQTADEEKRLERQAALLVPSTRRLFAAAGIGSGMKVLDLGSGAGDVAMLLAEMVGPTGSITGVDSNPTIVETASQRARAAGHKNIAFVAGDLMTVRLDDDFDAVVGRLILMYQRDPVAALRHTLQRVRSGGVVAFHEIDYTAGASVYPPTPLAQKALAWMPQALAYGGAETAMGMKLYQVFLGAGLMDLELTADAVIGGSERFVEAWTELTANGIRSVLPLLIEGGIATAEEVGIETLQARLREEALAQRSVTRLYLMMGAWARKT